MMANQKRLKAKSRRAKAYAAIEHEIKFPMTARVETIREFWKNVRNVTPIPDHPSG
jgi:hypothetical protein